MFENYGFFQYSGQLALLLKTSKLSCAVALVIIMIWMNFVVSHKSAIVRTVITWLGFICFGASSVLPGAALLDLEILLQEDFAISSGILTSKAAGYFTGGVSGNKSYMLGNLVITV